MNEKALPLVSFEQAKRLKELGFDWEVRNFYTNYLPDRSRNVNKDSVMKMNYNNVDNHYSAPTVALALQYVEQIYKIPLGVLPLANEFYAAIYFIDGGIIEVKGKFETKQQAESAFLDELITVISPQIEKEK